MVTEMERRMIDLHIPSLRKLIGCINKELYAKNESVANHEGWRLLAIYVSCLSMLVVNKYKVSLGFFAGVEV